MGGSTKRQGSVLNLGNITEKRYKQWKYHQHRLISHRQQKLRRVYQEQDPAITTTSTTSTTIATYATINDKRNNLFGNQQSVHWQCSGAITGLQAKAQLLC
jgi:hypothetical protein